jgi:hypothetical protein
MIPVFHDTLLVVKKFDPDSHVAGPEGSAQGAEVYPDKYVSGSRIYGKQ